MTYIQMFKCPIEDCGWVGPIDDCWYDGNSDEPIDYYCPECYKNYILTLVKEVEE